MFSKFSQLNRYQILGGLILGAFLLGFLVLSCIAVIYNLQNDGGLLSQFFLAFDLFLGAIYIYVFTLIFFSGVGYFFSKKNGVAEAEKSFLIALFVNGCFLVAIFFTT